MSCERLPRGEGYFLKIWPPVAGLQPQESPTAEGGARTAPLQAEILHVVTRINQAIEAIVLSQPGQYLWGYARYKTPRKDAF